nr:hypothetical protein Iba_chr13bCG12910 [Ipomoea batatas]
MHIRIDVGSFSTSLGFLFLGSLGLPQTTFCFLEWVRAIFSEIPSFKIVVTVRFDGRIEFDVEDHVARHQYWHPRV